MAFLIRKAEKLAKVNTWLEYRQCIYIEREKKKYMARVCVCVYIYCVYISIYL